MKKYISLIIVLILISGMVILPVSAQESENPRNVLQFDANTAKHWNTPYEKVYCHIWEYDAEPFFNWQSISERCVDDAKDGVWTYDLDKHGIVLEDDKVYGCIFSNENGKSTYTLIFDKTVLGDVAYCNGEYYDSPEETYEYMAFWRNQESTLNGFGPVLFVSSIGQVIGYCIPKTTTAYLLFEDFLINKMDNARIYSGEADQQIIDNIAVKLQLTVDDIHKAINSTQITVDWKWWQSLAPLGDFTPIIGDADGDMTLSVIDATTIQCYKADTADIPQRLLDYADVDGDKSVSVLDATQIQLMLAQLV